MIGTGAHLRLYQSLFGSIFHTMKDYREVSAGRSARFQPWKQIVLALLITSSVVFLYDGYRRTRSAALDGYSRQQQIYARQIVSEIRFRFEFVRNVLQLWSGHPGIGSISGETPEYMIDLLEAHGSYISGVTRMDENGIIRFTRPLYEGAEGTDISFQPHVQELLDTRAPVMSDAFMTVQGYWAVACHVPCFDGEGRFTGSLAFLVPFREMFRDLFSQMFPEESITALVLRRDGLILYSPLKDHEGIHFEKAFPEDEGLLRLCRSVSAKGPGYVIEDIASFAPEPYRSVRMHCTVVPFDFHGTGWTMVLSVPEAFVISAIAGLSNRWLAGMAAVFLLALIYTGMKVKSWISSMEEKKWEDIARLKDVLLRTVDQAGEAIVILDRRERIIYSNRAAGAVTGYAVTYVGRRIADVPFEEFRPPPDEIRERVMRCGSWRGRVEGKPLENPPFMLDLTVSAVTDDDGIITNLIIIGRDVTAQVDMERRMIEQQKMEAVGQLAGGLAHDFNNLLVGVLGYAELLKEHHDSDSEVSRAADVIMGAAHQASELTRQLLGYAGRGKHRLESVDLGSCVRNVNKLLKRTLDRRIDIVMDLMEDVTVRGDPSQMEQVILNLALNARDAMPDGGRLEFVLRKLEVPPEVTGPGSGTDPAGFAVLTVTDSGCGIVPENIERIFEPFFTTKISEGTGMGLATVYGIVTNHGGWVEVDSRPEEGSVFTLYLPLDRAGKPAAKELQGLPEGAVEGAGGAVLVIDDEFMVVNTLTELLSEIGYEVISAPDGRRGAEIFSRDPSAFDAVILDLSMPGMDGRDCFALLRDADPSVKVILVTGFGKDGRVQELLDMGVRGFLQKPFRLAELAQMLTDMLAP